MRAAAAHQPPGTTRTLLTERDGGVTSRVRRTVLPGGLRVVTEAMPGVRSACVGVWVGVGSRDETPRLAGASHFLEHLLFKGTPTRSALDLSAQLDAVGGEVNAFTAKEYTCFHARVLDVDLPLAVDVLGDMLTSSLLTTADVEAEREVILDEIAMHDDDPEDVAQNLFAATAWGTSPLGRPVAGTAESIRALTPRQIRGYYRRRYRPENMVVSVAGNVEHAKVVRRVRRAFAAGGFLDDAEAAPSNRRAPARARRTAAATAVRNRPTEQANLVLGVPSLVRTDDRRYVLGVLNAVLGGGPSSRLFQEVRERRGLAYAVYSFAQHYTDAGAFGVAAGTLPDRVPDVLAVVREELQRVAEDGITEEELARGRGQLRGGLVLGLEDTGSRMARIAKADLLYEELPSIDTVLGRVDAVTCEDVRRLAQDLFGRGETLVGVGPFDRLPA